MSRIKTFPPQQIPFKKKNDEWRKKHLDWADNNVSSRYNEKVRSSIMNKKINYDLVNGKIHMDDLMLVMNPTGLNSAFIPDTIQHYPVMNAKLRVLCGEEIGRRFEYRVVCTNPNAISEIERKKQEELFQAVQNAIQSESKSEEEFKQKLQNIEKEFKYHWQDIREIRANALLNHYTKENNVQSLFADGFMDALTVGEEIYWCHMAGGEPVIERMNPMKLHSWRSGYSSRVEDADVIIYEDYWSLGKIYDTFADVLTEKDRKYLEDLPHLDDPDEMWNRDETKGFINSNDLFNFPGGTIVGDYVLFTDGGQNEVYDSDGNIRVLHMFWKSRRQIKKVKSYDPETGDTEYHFYSEDYQIDESLGEEEEIYWINEAWEGYKIGKEVYLQIRPCEIQFNTMENPSKCHFGFVGSYYNINEDEVFSLVDTLKPFAYLYDVVHERLNEAMEANFGQLFELDIASIPDKWTPEQWLFYAKKNHLAIKDSFKEGNVGAATGKLAGNFASNSRGLIGTNTGDYIQQHWQMLEYIKNEMSDACGISKQREGQIANRETVGGIERSTLQSSYITEWLFNTHSDVKKRVLECYLEVLKFAMKGKNKKFQYVLSDSSLATLDVDGDEFSENDYGLVVDNSPYAQNLTSKLEMLGQAALQNQMISFSSLMKIYTSNSLAETMRMIEAEEDEMRQQQSEQVRQQAELQKQEQEMRMQLEQQKLELQDMMNQRDNETRLQIAQIQTQGHIEAEQIYGDSLIDEEVEMAKIKEDARQFDAQLAHDKEEQAAQRRLEQRKQNLEEQQHKEDKSFKERELKLKAEEVKIKRKQANKKPSQS